MKGKEAYEYILKNKHLIDEFTLVDVEDGKIKWFRAYNINEFNEKLFKNDFNYWDDEEFEEKSEFTDDGYYDNMLYGIKFNSEYEFYIEQYTKGYVDNLKAILNEKLTKKEIIDMQQKYHIGW